MAGMLHRGRLALAVCACVTGCMGYPEHPARSYGFDPNAFYAEVPTHQSLSRRARPVVMSDLGTGGLLALSLNHSLIASDQLGESWTQVTDPARAHVPLVEIVPGSSRNGVMCVVGKSPYEAVAFCRTGPDAPWRRLQTGANAEHEGFHALVVGGDGPLGLSVFGAADRRPVGGLGPERGLQIAHPSSRLGASQDFGATWADSPIKWQEHLTVFDAAPGVVIGVSVASSPRLEYLYCDPLGQCRALDLHGCDLLVSVEPDVSGRMACHAGSPFHGCVLVAEEGASPLGIAPRFEHCGKVFLLNDRAHGVIAVRSHDGAVTLWHRDPQAAAVTHLLPEAGCALHVTREGLMSCAGTTALYISRNLGRDWSATCRAGSCALYDAAAVPGTGVGAAASADAGGKSR